MEQKQTGSRAYLISIVMVAVLGGLLFGYDTAVISGAEKGLQAFFMGAEDFTYTDFWHGFTSSSALIGCIIGSALSGVLASNWGRKRSLIFAGVMFFISAWGSMCPESLVLPKGEANLTLLIVLNCDSEEEGELFVGCAGGADLNVSMQFKEDTYIPEGDVAVKISLTGLKGGHSGVDIHLGRANANKLMFRFLKEAVRDYGARLSSIDGGSLRNAIPREAFAIITIPGDNVEALWELVSDYQEMYRSEYKGIEHNINFTAEMTDMPVTLIPEEIQDDLINAIEGCQNGVISMLVDFPGTVESSTNLAIVKSSNEMIEIQILVRSSSESRKEAVCSSLESIFSLAGAKVEYSDGYGGWQPNIDSPILKIMQQAYLDLYGKKPEAKVMHAGLECGIIQESYPDMDMISIGPDLQHPHSPDERVSIPSVARTWDFIVTTLARI